MYPSQKTNVLVDFEQIQCPCAEANVEGCKGTLERAFSPGPGTPGTHGSPRKHRQQVMQMNADLLSKCEPHRAWRASSRSCLLCLNGMTRVDGRASTGFTHSWLSPAAIYIAEEIQKQQHRMAFFSCHPDIQGDVYSARHVLSLLIYQVLKWNPAILRHSRQQFLTSIQSVTWREDHNKREGIREMCRLLHRAMGNVRSEPGFAYIIMDRLDLCSSKLRYLMHSLIDELIMQQPSKVKIVAIFDSTNSDWDFDDLSEDVASRIMVEDDWDQQHLSMQEIHQQSQIRG